MFLNIALGLRTYRGKGRSLLWSNTWSRVSGKTQAIALWATHLPPLKPKRTRMMVFQEKSTFPNKEKTRKYTNDYNRGRIKMETENLQMFQILERSDTVSKSNC